MVTAELLKVSLCLPMATLVLLLHRRTCKCIPIF